MASKRRKAPAPHRPEPRKPVPRLVLEQDGERTFDYAGFSFTASETAHGQSVFFVGPKGDRFCLKRDEDELNIWVMRDGGWKFHRPVESTGDNDLAYHLIYDTAWPRPRKMKAMGQHRP